MRRSPPGPQTPEAILGERLARGEIDSEEYRQRLNALRTEGPAVKE
jgi:putative membrane protein